MEPDCGALIFTNIFSLSVADDDDDLSRKFEEEDHDGGGDDDGDVAEVVDLPMTFFDPTKDDGWNAFAV